MSLLGWSEAQWQEFEHAIIYRVSWGSSSWERTAQPFSILRGILVHPRSLSLQVGYDQYSFGYRDLEGSKVHSGLRQQYGLAYGQGDVIGCLLHMPPGGRPFEKESKVRGE